MEFKVLTHAFSLPGSFVLIESDWNLKLFLPVPWQCLSEVLIESDWNLKETPEVEIDGETYVLIESDWNLKNASSMSI